MYVLGWNGRPNYYGNRMKIYEVCSDIAAICLEMGGNNLCEYIILTSFVFGGDV